MSTLPPPTILFAGLGAMGSNMAAALLRHNYRLIAHDVHAPTLRAFLNANPTAVAFGGANDDDDDDDDDDEKSADVLVVMVANERQVEEVLFDPVIGVMVGGGLKRGGWVVICSTVSPRFVVGLEGRIRGGQMGRGDVRVVDCPVSGGPGRAGEGMLSVFWSSSSGSSSREKDHDDDKEKDMGIGGPHVRSLLSCLSDVDKGKLYRVPGGMGAGSKAKLIHQMFAGVHIALAAEVMGLAAVSGLDTRLVYEELKKGEGESWIFGNRVRYMLDPEGEGRYSALGIIHKDMGIVAEMARGERFPVPICGVAEQLFVSGVSNGWGDVDDWVVVRLYLGQRPGLVVERAGRPGGKVEGAMLVGELADLLVGVQLAVVSEAMGFCEVLGIDVDLMFEIVRNAAGASRVFERCFGDMKRKGWRVEGAEGVEGIRDRLMNAVAKARQLSPLFLSSAALQELNRQLR